MPDDDDDDGGGAAPGPGHNRRGKPTEHAKVGETLLGMMHSRGEALCHIHDQKKRTHLWYYQDGLWTMLPEPAKWLDHAIEVMLRAMGKAHKSKVKFVTEVRKYIERSPDILEPGEISWDDHGKVPTRSGLIDPVTLAIEPFQKEHYATWRLDLDYDPAATCPLWEELLGDYFDAEAAEEREKRITLLQDFAGTTLIDQLPKALKRALVLHGASDTGKSILLRVLSAMLADTPISTSLADISGPHGLEEFMRRRRGCSTKPSTSASGISAPGSRRSSPESRSASTPRTFACSRSRSTRRRYGAPTTRPRSRRTPRRWSTAC